MELVIEKTQIKDWLAGFKKNFKVVDIRKSVLPAKQYFFPPREEIFHYNRRNRRLSSTDPRKKLLLFGLDLADLRAMTFLDEIMKTPYADFFYWQKRKNAILVGLSNKSVETAPGGDIILEKINAKQYRVLVLTNRGKKLAQGRFLKRVNVKIRRRVRKLDLLKELLVDSELLSDAIAWSVNHRIWDELAEKCLGCGVCTYVCPICHCFSIDDKVALDDIECSRCRQWDACTLPGFARVAGGHNFHRSLKERYYNWFYHKFVRAYNEYGKAQCVGCGRCKDNCPAGINIEEILSEIVKGYQKSKQ